MEFYSGVWVMSFWLLAISRGRTAAGTTAGTTVKEHGFSHAKERDEFVRLQPRLDTVGIQIPRRKTSLKPRLKPQDHNCDLNARLKPVLFDGYFRRFFQI